MNSRVALKPNDVINHLTIKYLDHKDHRGRKHFLCRCQCGNEKVIQGSLITSGNTKSCGCWGREEKRLRNLLPANGGVVNQIILGYKRHAKGRHIDWLLERTEVDDLIRLPCVYCGIGAGNVKKTKNCKEGFAYNGIDRLDPSLPYRTDNVAPCCGFCNRAKQGKTREAFLEWIGRVCQNAMAEQWNF